jgi:hypothetical protein
MASNKVHGARYGVASGSTSGRYIANTLNRIIFYSAIIVAVVAVLALVVISPLALRRLSPLGRLNWTQLSNIGQTYGAASALLTGLALIGVVGSMVFQAQAIRVSRQQSYQEHLGHLTEMALTDPVYQRSLGGDPAEFETPEKFRQQVYVNLTLSAWQNHYRLGGLREHALRDAIAFMFRGEAGREFWDRYRDVRLKTSESRRDRRFCRVVEEEYKRAVDAGPPVVPAEAPSVVPSVSLRTVSSDSVIKTGTALLVGVMGGIVLGTLARRRMR